MTATQPSFTIGTQLWHVTFLTTKTAVRENQENDGPTGSPRMDKPGLAQGGGGVPFQTQHPESRMTPAKPLQTLNDKVPTTLHNPLQRPIFLYSPHNYHNALFRADSRVDRPTTEVLGWGKFLQEGGGGGVRAPFESPPPSPKGGALLPGHSKATRSYGTGQGPQQQTKSSFGISASWGVRKFARKWPKSRSLTEERPFQDPTLPGALGALTTPLPTPNQNRFRPTEGQNEQWREANRRRQRQTIRYRGLVPTPPPPRPLL